MTFLKSHLYKLQLVEGSIFFWMCQGFNRRPMPDNGVPCRDCGVFFSFTILQLVNVC